MVEMNNPAPEPPEGPRGHRAPPSRTDWVTERLRDAILRGELHPGDRLLISHLRERWAISQTPLREAVQRLAAEGWVVQTSQRGARVASVSIAEMHELYELRLLLEPMALERALAHVTDQELRAADAAFDELRVALAKDPIDFAEEELIHRRFHAELRSACDSQWLLRLVDTLTDHCARYRTLSWVLRGGSRAVLDEHADLLDAFRRRDVPTAVRLCRKHIQLTHDAVNSLAQPEIPLVRT